MSIKPKAGTWRGRFYLRQKQTDKWGNKYKDKPTWRQTGSGVVVDKFGNFLGYERPLHHKYARDERKGKKPLTFVRPNNLGALKPRSAHVRRL